MNATFKYALAGATAALIGTAMAASANASYLGYANGDPGNWGFYQEQHNGASPPAQTYEPRVRAGMDSHPARIEYHGREYLRSGVQRTPGEY